MNPLIETVLFVFGLVAFGYVAAASGFLKKTTGDGLTDFCVSVALPLLLFRTIARVDFGGHAPWLLWLTYFSGVLVAWVCGTLVIRRIFGRDARAGVVAGVSTGFSNLVLLGIPFTLSAFGDEGFAVLSLIVSVHLPIMLGASILLFEIAQRRDGIETRPLAPLAMAADFAVKLLTNPFIIGILTGLVWRITGLELPSLANRFVDALANVAGPVALFAMGLGLRQFGISGNVRPALVIAGLKLFLMPAIVLASAKLFGLPPFAASIAVVAASLPTGTNPYLIATRFGTGQALASNAMTVSTAMSVLTTAFWLMVVHAVM